MGRRKKKVLVQRSGTFETSAGLRADQGTVNYRLVSSVGKVYKPVTPRYPLKQVVARTLSHRKESPQIFLPSTTIFITTDSTVSHSSIENLDYLSLMSLPR